MLTSLVFDHAIIRVDDLDSAMADYRTLGFTVFYGGRHASGGTHNALIVLPDGTYLELLAPTGDAPADSGAVDYRGLFQRGEGLAGYALRSADLKAAVAAMRAKGVMIADPTPGGRARPDGEQLRWQTALIEGTASPFFIQDETPRVLRVPDDPDKIHHVNGVKGVAGITLAVESLDAAATRYEALLNMKANVDANRARFVLNGVVIRLALPTDNAMRQHAELHGDSAPYLLTLRTDDGAFIGSLDMDKAHGARIALVE